MSYVLFTDGSCKGNPGPGGWAFLLKRPDGTQRTYWGSSSYTTNNRMEVEAIIQGLHNVPIDAEVKIVTDSRYAIIIASSGNPKLKNRELIERYRDLLAKVRPTFQHVKGHSGPPENEMVDRLASGAARQQRQLKSICG